MKKYVITSYTQGSEVDEKALSVLESYCDINNAQLLIALCAPLDKKDAGLIHARIEQYILKKDKKFNNSLFFLDQRLNSTVLDPVSGFDSIANAKGSLILGSPRHRFKSVPRSLKHSSSPRDIWCTGSISNVEYKDNKAGLRANDLHKLGALVVMIENKDIFHIRQLSIEDGKMYDLCQYYNHEGQVIGAIPSALVLGDLHPPFTNKKVLEATKTLMRLLKPENVVYHDVFDAASISHHVEGKNVTKAQIYSNLPSLREEIQLTWGTLKELRDELPRSEHHIIRSNHDEHLDRYLDEARYIKDYVNKDIALKLASYKLSGEHSLKAALSMVAGIHVFDFNFLNREDTLTISGIECSNHGDYGANGKSGSTAQHGIAFNGNVVTGHSHSSEIGVYGNYVVGTMTDLSLPYTNDSGTSGWLNTHALIYPDGNMTHIHLIKK